RLLPPSQLRIRSRGTRKYCSSHKLWQL
ncbi:hypothetical protein CFOL_v3_36495, partial [Cephalotus follicularis]